MAEAVAEQEQGQKAPERSLVVTVLMALVLLYFAGFALVIIDILFFDEQLWNLLPDAIEGQVQAGLRTIYAPLIWILSIFL